MAVKELENKRDIVKDANGNFVFSHTLVQEMGQSNVNALVEKFRNDKEQSEQFLENYDSILEEIKEQTRKELEERKREMEEYLDSITEDNKVEIALELLDKSLEIRREFVKNFDEYVEEQYKLIIDKKMEPQKAMAMKSKSDAEKTLELWEGHYKNEE